MVIIFDYFNFESEKNTVRLLAVVAALNYDPVKESDSGKELKEAGGHMDEYYVIEDDMDEDKKL